ncbi:unnamed protein product [Malus baccata var. baccata]
MNLIVGDRDRVETAMASGASTPPYPSAARISDSQCYPQYTASLKCLEEYNSDKSKCQKHFDIYKECKKQEESIVKNFVAMSFSIVYPHTHQSLQIEGIICLHW